MKQALEDWDVPAYLKGTLETILSKEFDYRVKITTTKTIINIQQPGKTDEISSIVNITKTIILAGTIVDLKDIHTLDHWVNKDGLSIEYNCALGNILFTLLLVGNSYEDYYTIGSYLNSHQILKNIVENTLENLQFS